MCCITVAVAKICTLSCKNESNPAEENEDVFATLSMASKTTSIAIALKLCKGRHALKNTLVKMTLLTEQKSTTWF